MEASRDTSLEKCDFIWALMDVIGMAAKSKYLALT